MLLQPRLSWMSTVLSVPMETLTDMKDRVRVLVNNLPDTINAQGFATKVRTFDLVSAVMVEEFVGSLKMWYLPCIFDCIIDD